MSLNISSKNIYLISPENRYDISPLITDFMEKDFTIFVRTKINRKLLQFDEPCYIFSRNGQHSGISVIMNGRGEVMVNFGYWFELNDIESPYKQFTYLLPKEIVDLHNEYVMTCDDKLNEFKFYVNGVEVGKLSYKSTRISYTYSYIWIGCGDMHTDSLYKNIGNFDYDQLILMDKLMTIDDINDIAKNEKYIVIDPLYDLPVLTTDTPYKDNIKMYCNFDHKSNYKLWNMNCNSNYLRKFNESNVNF